MKNNVPHPRVNISHRAKRKKKKKRGHTRREGWEKEKIVVMYRGNRVERKTRRFSRNTIFTKRGKGKGGKTDWQNRRRNMRGWGEGEICRPPLKYNGMVTSGETKTSFI